MKSLHATLLSSILVVVCGCNQGTPGGPGAQVPTGPQAQVVNKPIIGEAKETFSLSLPVLSTSLKQGETKAVSLSVSRGTNFEDDIQLSFSDLPTGVTIDPATSTLAHDQKDQKLNVVAAPDAALGDFKINVIGHPSKGGPDAVNQLKLTISAK